MKFTVIANCQSGPIGNLILALAPELTLVRSKPIHTLKADDRDDFDRVIAEADVVIHQQIGASFKDYAIEAVKQRFPEKRFLSFPSLYFTGYQPWLMYLRKPAGGTLKGVLGDYHDERVVRAYIDGLTIDQAVDRMGVEAVDAGFFEAEFTKLELRETGLDARSVDYLREHYRKRKLFYVMNHPANEVMIHVALQLLTRLGLAAEEEGCKRAASRPEYLRTTYAPIDATARLHGIDAPDESSYGATVAGKMCRWSQTEYVAASFDQYSAIDDMPNLFRYALARRVVLG